MALDDVVDVARALRPLPPGARASALDVIILRARAADAYRKRTGSWHPNWGGGALGQAARASKLAPAGRVSDDDWCACLKLALEGLMTHRADVRDADGKVVTFPS